MCDNAKCYAKSHQFPDTLRRARRPPHPHPALHTPLERQDRTLLGTLDSEWAHSRVWPNSTTRDRALKKIYPASTTAGGPHSAAGGRPPITRVQQDRGQIS